MPDRPKSAPGLPPSGPWSLPTLDMHDYRPDPAHIRAALGLPPTQDADPHGRIPDGVQQRGR